VQEVTELIRVWAKHPPQDEHEAALVLLEAANEFQKFVDQPVGIARNTSALHWLSLIDNCRACRQAPALSKDIVAAAGIALPSEVPARLPARADCEDFLHVIRGLRRSLAKQLKQWLQTPHSTAHLAASVNTFYRLADACEGASRLASLEPLFRASGVVLQSLVDNPKLSSTAIHHLFARVERYLASLARMDYTELSQEAHLLADDILRQLLFYVAILPNASKHATRLQEAFGLHVLTASAANSAGARVNTAASWHRTYGLTNLVKASGWRPPSSQCSAAVQPPRRTVHRG